MLHMWMVDLSDFWTSQRNGTCSSSEPGSADIVSRLAVLQSSCSKEKLILCGRMSVKCLRALYIGVRSETWLLHVSRTSTGCTVRNKKRTDNPENHFEGDSTRFTSLIPCSRVVFICSLQHLETSPSTSGIDSILPVDIHFHSVTLRRKDDSLEHYSLWFFVIVEITTSLIMVW